jgi:hypothetical protein
MSPPQGFAEPWILRDPGLKPIFPFIKDKTRLKARLSTKGHKNDFLSFVSSLF